MSTPPLDLPRKHLHTFPHGSTLPDPLTVEDGFPYLLETTVGLVVTRALWQNQNGVWTVLTGSTAQTVNAQTGDYTLVLLDAGALVEFNLSANAAVTIPPNSAVAFPIGTTIDLVVITPELVTVTAGAGVTIVSTSGAVTLAGQACWGHLRQRATNEWVLYGALV